ncbi:hypothetical protein OAT39_03770, partial [Candidatus Thioglobus sp.]|nr:hypothetical protein [Candidatus Thioglobus sp.]
DFNAVFSVFGNTGQDGGTARFELDYAVDDQMSVSAGVIDYLPGDNLTIDSFKDNDRIFTKLSYGF